MNSKILIITVNFRHDECTLLFLNSASRLAGFRDCNLIIVDNNSEDGSVSRIRLASAEFSNVDVSAFPENVGYFGGANAALQLYLVDHEHPEWVVVCNNDIVFDDPHFLRHLLERTPGKAGVIAPAIISSLTGYDANPSIRRRPSRVRMWRYRLWVSNYYTTWFQQWLAPFVRKIRRRFRRPSVTVISGTQPIYAPHGSLLIFSRRFFEAGGFLDDGAFLYAEELRVAEMCRQLRLPIVHDPQLGVFHQESQSTGRMLTRSVYAHQKAGFMYAWTRYNDGYPELCPAIVDDRTARPHRAAEMPSVPAGESIL